MLIFHVFKDLVDFALAFKFFCFLLGYDYKNVGLTILQEILQRPELSTHKYTHKTQRSVFWKCFRFVDGAFLTLKMNTPASDSRHLASISLPTEARRGIRSRFWRTFSRTLVGHTSRSNNCVFRIPFFKYCVSTHHNDAYAQFLMFTHTHTHTTC